MGTADERRPQGGAADADPRDGSGWVTVHACRTAGVAPQPGVSGFRDGSADGARDGERVLGELRGDERWGTRPGDWSEPEQAALVYDPVSADVQRDDGGVVGGEDAGVGKGPAGCVPAGP